LFQHDEFELDAKNIIYSQITPLFHGFALESLYFFNGWLIFFQKHFIVAGKSFA
jgi:hypothetical protein